MSIDHQSSGVGPGALVSPVKLRIVCLADTHGLHRQVVVPPGDLLIHAGDFTYFGQHRSQILDFNAWLGELRHQHKVVIPGNHEFAFERDPSLRRVMTNAVLLVDEGVELFGFHIWGSPITPLYGGAFGRSRLEDRVRVYAVIPDKTDILITHGPPRGILDRPPGSVQDAGCAGLREAVGRIKPAIHVFGHIHGAYGTFASNGIVSANAALADEPDGHHRTPIVIDVLDERPIGGAIDVTISR